MSLDPRGIGLLLFLSPLGLATPSWWLCAALGAFLANRCDDWRPRWTWLGALWPFLSGAALASWAAGHDIIGSDPRPAEEARMLYEQARLFELVNLAGCLAFLAVLGRQGGIGLLLLIPGAIWFGGATTLTVMFISNEWL